MPRPGWQASLYFGIISITALPFFAKRFAENFHWPWVLYVLVAAILFAAARNCDLSKYKVANSNLTWLSGAFILAVLNFVLYPATRNVANPSTAPNALIEPATALLEGKHPYSVILFDGAPISPGPGWIILNAPITLSGMMFAFIPIYLAISAYALSRIEAWRANAFVFLLALSVCFLQMNVTAHDLVAFSLAGVALTVLAHRFQNNMILLALVAILCGVVATARLPFFLFPIAVAACLFHTDRAKAVAFGLIATFVLVSVHGVFFLWADQLSFFYQPAHVFGRASKSQSVLQTGFTVALWVVISVRLWLKTTSNLSSWFLLVWAIQFIPFAATGFAELFTSQGISIDRLADWEGKGYLYFTIPFLASALVLPEGERRQAPG